jgi:hippurate hydrolase
LRPENEATPFPTFPHHFPPFPPASEDFARFLEHVPGCFVFLGNGTDSLPLHNAAFDCNDEALGYGARFHVELARRRLPVSGAGLPA